RLGDDDTHTGTSADAEVLRADVGGDRAVGVDGDGAVAAVAGAGPGMDGNAEAALDRAWRGIATEMRLALVADQVGCDIQLFAVNIPQSLRGVIEVLFKEFESIHAKLGSQVFHRSHGDKAALGMIWSAPSLGLSTIGHDTLPNDFAVGNISENIGELRRSAKISHAGCAPAVGLPGGDAAF